MLANSGVASVLVLLHVWLHGVHFSTSTSTSSTRATDAACVGFGTDLLLAGIVANYAAVAADTLSSELGILATSQPRLITTMQSVPRGTNGGVTVEGLLAGVVGSSVIAMASVLVGTFCPWTHEGWLQGRRETWTVGEKGSWILAVVVLGALGSVLDSVLGALLQASVLDRRSGKVVEGVGGGKVMVSSVMGKKSDDVSVIQRKPESGEQQSRQGTGHEGGRSIGTGRDLLDNNQINLLMASIMSMCGIITASWLWDVPISSIWS